MKHNTLKKTLSLLLVICMMASFAGCIPSEEDHTNPSTIETTAMGAAYLSGLAVGYWESKDAIKQNHEIAKTFAPNMDEQKRVKLLHGWHRAVTASCVRISQED